MTALSSDFYARDVLEVARELIGCRVEFDGRAGMIVETEAYHEREPACHAFIGLTPRTRTLFGPPGHAYLYRAYGIHILLNAVCELEGVGAAVLIRALEPTIGLEAMRARRGLTRRSATPVCDRELCSGPGKLTEALGIGLELNGEALSTGVIRILSSKGRSPAAVLRGPRIGITKAASLPWRFWVSGNANVSRPRGIDAACPKPVFQEPQ